MSNAQSKLLLPPTKRSERKPAYPTKKRFQTILPPNTDTNQDILFQGSADRGMFSREHNLIALLKNADASTFVHELGHFFLETNTRIARDLTAKPVENLTE